MGQRSAAASTIAVDVEERGDPPGTAPARPDRPRGGTIRGRLVRILALPMTAVVVLLGLVAAGPVGDYRESRATARSVDLVIAVSSLVEALQDERGVASLVLGGNESFRDELTRVRAEVDRRRTALDRVAGTAGDAGSRVRRALQSLDGLGPVRAATDSGAAGRQATFAFYTGRIDALSRVDVGLGTLSDPELASSVSELLTLQDVAEATSQARALLSGVFSAGGFGKGEFVEFARMRAQKDLAWQRYVSLADDEDAAAARYVRSTGAARTVAYFEQVALGAADGRRIVVNPQSWWSAHTTVLDGIRALRDHDGSVIQQRAFQLQRDAQLRLGGLLAVVLLVIVGTVYLAVLASMSVSRPLAALAAEAQTVATQRLPDAMRRLRGFDPDSGGDAAPPRPAPVTPPRRASAEIRSVVAALNNLQESAYRLAVEQALQRRATLEALTNLGRRNQNLVRKQLRFISNLEKEEMDPTGLSNLFELDHLATRMRRNAASLLVLTGAQTPGQWTTPAPIADVMRAAVSEVEDYRRVALRRVDEVLVSGAVVGSLAHLLSELIENGLRFSPPDSEVEVVGRLLGDDYLVAVVDQGIGMSQQDLEDANGRLRGEGDFMVTPSRFLGHYVVGRLAEQAGVRVELLPSPVTGVTARVHVPSALLVRPGQLEAGQVIRTTDLPAAEPAHAAPPVPAAPAVSAVPPLSPMTPLPPMTPVPPITPVPPLSPAASPAASPAMPMSGPIPLLPAAALPSSGPIAMPTSAPTGMPVASSNGTGTPLPRVPVPAVSGPIDLGPARDGSPAQPSTDRVVIDIRDAGGRPGSIFEVPAPSALADGQPPEGPYGTPLTGNGAAGPGSPGVPGVPGAGPTPDQRTRNGLRVRVPGSTRPVGRGRTAAERARPDAPSASMAPPLRQGPVEETAQGRLGGRLAALRSGMQRGMDAAPSDGEAEAGRPGTAGTQTEERP